MIVSTVLVIYYSSRLSDAFLCLAVSDSCNLRDYSPPVSSICGIFQARILEWVAFPTPGDIPQLGIEPMSIASPALAG